MRSCNPVLSFAIGAVAAVVLLAGCAQTDPYRTRSDSGATLCEPSRGDPGVAVLRGVPGGSVGAECAQLYTERSASYRLHIVEFDDQGWVHDSAGTSTAEHQIDSAVQQIKKTLEDRQKVRLFVYVHGWRHFAAYDDSDVKQFRLFLQEMNSASNGAQVIGIYVGWRGLPIDDIVPLTYLTFWDRKRAAERVAQGSVRELFGRLHALSDYKAAPAGNLLTKQQGKPDEAQLRTYVIAHSFGSSVAFRALSQSVVDSFTGDLDTDAAAVSRFVDMVVLVNPAIEASRFEVVRRSALKRQTLCEAANKPFCDQPKYQAPVLTIFQSRGDWATEKTFPVGAVLGNLFQKEITPEEKYANRHTIGWDDRYQTHDMTEESSCKGAPSEGPPHEEAGAIERYARPGWTWCVTKDNIAIKHLGPPQGRVAYNGPFWDIRVDASIIANHDDIWNPRFRSVLIRMFADEGANPLR